MARRKRMTRVKSNRSYTIPHLAEVVGVTPQTIRAWGKRGLPIMPGQIPHLILGADAKDFEAQVLVKTARPLMPGEFFCFRCKGPREAAFRWVNYEALTPLRGVLTAFCATCEGDCRRFVSRADLADWAAHCEIGGNTNPQA